MEKEPTTHVGCHYTAQDMKLVDALCAAKRPDGTNSKSAVLRDCLRVASPTLLRRYTGVKPESPLETRVDCLRTGIIYALQNLGKIELTETLMKIQAVLEQLLELDKLHVEAASSKVRTCRSCGCTDADCSGCIEATGHPCHWVEQDLCSRCEPEPLPELESEGT